ncbi:MAG: hypothetical protein ACJ72W_03855, partial [Actinoallomurus sp.]
MAAARSAPGSGRTIPTASSTDHVPAGEHSVTLVTGDVVTTRRVPGAGGKPGGTVTVRGAD